MSTYPLYGIGCPQCEGLGIIAYNDPPNKNWSCMDWIVWHKDMNAAFQDGRLAKFSKEKALSETNRVFAYHWSEIPWNDSKKFFSKCSYESSFVNYFKSVGYTDHISFIGAIVGKTANAAVDIAEGATETAKAVVKTSSNTAKTLNWLVPVTLVGAVGLVGYYFYKNYAKGNRRVKVGPASV